jgi:glucose-6-phosphate isomerase/transaldolase/glucose-6-phosphate isomerase
MTDRAATAAPLPRFALGDSTAAFEAAIARAHGEEWAVRLFDRDTTLWAGDERVREAIADRLGWLDAPDHFAARTAALEGFGDGAVQAGFTTAVIGGMGGSSLAPDVLHRTFGTTDGYLGLRILDSTDPAFVAATVDDLDPLTTLFIVASKSGTTTEPNAFLADAWARAHDAIESRKHDRWEQPGELIAAITDPGKALRAIPHTDRMREVFLNPPDIGGRYSALTYVGLVPASLIGLDLDALLSSATAMLGACREPAAAANPGVSLGVAMGVLARAGRDKLTFLIDDEIASFGAWAEQLIAESTGKAGTGVVPIDVEPLAPAAAYGQDRAFVRIALDGGNGGGRDALADELEAAGHPVIRIAVGDPIDLGGEFVRWEVATAIAGAVLGIDPFDQPNVEEAKLLTKRLLEGVGPDQAEMLEHPTEWAGAHEVDAPDRPESVPILARDDELTLIGDAAMRLTAGDGTVVGELARHLARRRPDAYLAIQAFIAPSAATDAAIARIRALLLERTGRATTAGYGPRFLHSTGQLHKGGARIGWFLQLTSDHPADRAIPGWPYTFGRLIDAQAAGDFGAIESHDLPILRIHLGSDIDAGLAALERAVAAALDLPAGAGSSNHPAQET